MNTAFILVGAAILAIVIVIPVFGLGRKTKKPRYKSVDNYDKNFVKTKWSEIQGTFSLGGVTNMRSAIIEADKLVDYTLKGKHFDGETMAERLKSAKSAFSNFGDYDNLWFAHKVRNQIAHEASHELNSAEAKKCIEYFKKALTVLGAL